MACLAAPADDASVAGGGATELAGTSSMGSIENKSSVARPGRKPDWIDLACHNQTNDQNEEQIHWLTCADMQPRHYHLLCYNNVKFGQQQLQKANNERADAL